MFGVVVFVILFKLTAQEYPDLTPEAITVYRNPEFFKNLNFGARINSQKSAYVPEAKAQESHKYPGETTKPNPPPSSPGFEINYDNSPEFHHEPRDIFVDTNYKPSRRKGPYSPKYHNENSQESQKEVRENDSGEKPVRENDSEEKPVRENDSEEKPVRENDSEEGSRESKENDSAEEPRDFVSVFNEDPEEEFQAYHEPILLARPNFDPEKGSGFVSNAYSKPYPYNRTRPLLYDEWKFYAYPKIYANEHLKSDSKVYSEEEPPANSFEDESASYYGHDDDDREDASNLFESGEFKNSGADTKHIYKKLLKPKKSFIFKFHSKPKLKKLKFKLKKHFHNNDWFDEYPFDF